MASIYPEIKTELEALQSTLENFALQSEVAPPPQLKENVLSAIRDVEQIKADDSPQEPIRTKSKPEHGRVIRMSRKWAAVGTVLIVSSMGILLFFNYESQENLIALEDQLQQKEEVLSEQATDLEALRQDYGELAAVNTTLANPGTQRVQMNGTDMYPEGVAQVYWNVEDQKVVMDKGNIPAPPEGQDYQLWAIIDGTPKSLGIYPWSPGAADPKIMSGEVASAAAFAVTLEPKGGSETPTMSNLFVIGEV